MLKSININLPLCVCPLSMRLGFNVSIKSFDASLVRQSQPSLKGLDFSSDGASSGSLQCSSEYL